MNKMRVAANLTMLFPEVELIERYSKAAAVGFRLVEVSLPYSVKAEDLRRKADEHGLEHVLINAPTGNWTKGFRGIAALSSHKEEFKESIDMAIHYAKTLNCPRIHVMAGIVDNYDESSHSTYFHNIKYAVDRMGQENLICLLEPINSYTIPNYYLDSYDQVLSVIEKICSPNLKVMYDLFHAQQINGQISATVRKLKEHIGHVQVAQVPNRKEPDMRGELDYAYVFDLLKETNANWIIGCEYVQSGPERKHFDWVRKYGLEF